MWICSNCETENEDNFKFCWSCGQTREKSKVAETQKIDLPISPNVELKKEPVRSIRNVEQIKSVEEINKAAELKPRVEPVSVNNQKPVEITNVERRNASKIEPELFSTVLPYPKNSPKSNDETDLEIKVFRIAVRLAGLFLVYQFIAALPDLVMLINAAVKNNAEFSDALTSDFVFPVAKLLFYFIAGIYLIASGRMLIRLVPAS